MDVLKATTHLGLVLLVTAIAIAHHGAAARADAGLGNPFALTFGSTPRLLSVEHPTLVKDGAEASRDYDFVARGYFKVHGRRAGTLPAFAGRTSDAHQRLTFTIARATRHAVGVAVRRAHGHRVTLTMVFRATQVGTTSTRTFAQDTFLAIPR
ncbi:MAG: hypothetical protein ACXVHB_18480 [Solirubrobacteraceae bacterium]